MAGVLGNPLGYKGLVTISNIDSTLSAGYYNTNVTLTVGTSSVPAYGTMLVLESNQYVTQTCYVSGKTFYRRYDKNMKAFDSWQVIDNFGYNTLADLATALKPLLGLS